MAEADTKQSQVLNDLASFYASNANFDFTPPASPVKVTPPTSDSEQEKQPVVIQRNVFISSQDVASRRRRTKPGTKTSTSATTMSSMANSNSNLNTAPLSPLAEGDSNDVTGSRRSRRRHGASSTSASTPASKHDGGSSSNSSSKPSSSTSLQRETPQRRGVPPDTTIPLQSESGNTGSALDKLKRRAASNERSGIPKGSMSSRRGVGDENGEMGKSRRGSSSDGRRRARRSAAHEEGTPAEASKDRAAPDRARSNDSLHDMNTSRSGEHRRSLPGRSRSNDDVLLEMDVSRSGEHRRVAPGRSRSNDDALLVEMDVSRSGEHRRKPPGRSRSNEDVLQADVDVDEDSKGSGGRRRRSRALSDEETPEKPSSATISSSEHSDETGKVSDPTRVRRAAKGTSPLDKLKNATNDVIGEGGKRSGWSGVKHGMDFINKAKAATEENRTSSSRRHDHERRRHRTERHTTREVSRSPSKSPERANGDGPSETPSKKEANSSDEITPRSPKKDSDERRRHRSPKRDHKTESSSSSGGHKHSRGRGNSKWSAIKERSVSRGQSADRLDSEDGHERTSTSRQRRSRRSEANASSNDHESHKHAATPMSYPSPIAEQPSPKVSSEAVTQAVPEPNLVEANEKQTPAESENSSSKKSSIFKSLLMGKGKSKKNEEDPTNAKHQSEPEKVTEEKPEQPSSETTKDETASSTQGESEDGDGKPHPQPETDGAEKPSSDKDLGKKSKSMLQKLLLKSSSHGEESTTTFEWSRSKPQAAKPENAVDDSQKKKSMLKKLLSTGSSKKDGEEGESKKKHSKWGGIKSGMEFTSKLMKVAGDKKHKEKEAEDPLDDVPDESITPTKDNATKDKTKTPQDNNASVDDDNMDGPTDGLDYGLMASLASFSAEAIEGLDELEIQETIQEEDDSEASDDHDAPTSFRSTQSNEVAAVLGAADDDNVDAFALFDGAMNASSSSLSGPSSSKVERPSMVGLRAPSMRLDSGPKVEKPSARAAPSVGMLIEEGDEEEEEESDEDEEPVHSKQPAPIQEEEDDEEEDDHDDGMNDNDMEADMSESSAEPVTLLSPLKVMQLSFGALSKNAKNSELSVSVHRLTEESKYQEEGDNGMCIHGTMGKGVKYDTRSCYSSEEESDFEDDDDFADQVEDGEPVVEEEEDYEEEENGMQAAVQRVEDKDTNDENENTLTIVCTVSPEVQLEYLRLQTALEASIVRAKAARDEVRALQVELQARRTCFGEVEKRRQQSLKDLQVHKVVVKR